MRVEEHGMRLSGMSATAIVLTSSVLIAGQSAATARATTKDDVAVNGTFRATSIGNWARINYQFNTEPTVVSTWKISSSCTDFQNCTGTLTSDQGWSAPIHLGDGIMWYARRDIPNWEKCQDGTAFTGKQQFYFYPVDPEGTGRLQIGSPVFAGKDKTLGPSGACGQNIQLRIDAPLRLDRVG